MTEEERQAYLTMDERILVRVIRNEDELSEGQATRILRERAALRPSPTEAQIEKAARAICENHRVDPDSLLGMTDPNEDGPSWKVFVSDARAALCALSSQDIPQP